MPNPLIRDFKSIVLTSQTPDQTAAFYRDVLMLPLERDQHRGVDRHWAGAVGSMHFAVHQHAGFWLQPPSADPRDSTFVSFTTTDLPGLVEHVTASGVDIVARREIGPMSFVALRDPDRRIVCVGTPWPEPRSRSRE